MGCFTKFIYTVGALWLFSLLGWFEILYERSLWSTAFWVMAIVMLVDAVLLMPKLFSHLIALPASCLTSGVATVVVEAIFKYAGLLVAQYWLKSISVPWILSNDWWQAAVIAITFVAISYASRPRSRSSSSK